MRPKPTATRRLQATRNFLLLSGAEIISKLLTLAAFAYVARVVGPVAFGYVEIATSVVLCAGLLVDQGFGQFGAREIARRSEATPLLVGEITSLRMALAVVVYGGLALLTWLVDRPAELERLVLVFGLALFLMPLTLQWVFQGHDRMQAVGAMQVVRQGVFAVVVFALLRGPEQLWSVAAAEVAGTAAVAAISWWLYAGHFPRPTWRLGFSSRLLREGSTIGLGQLLWSLRLYGATVLVGALASGDEVGYFGAAMRVAIGLNAFVWLYFFNLLPSLSRAWAEPDDAFAKLIERSLRTTGWLTVGGGMLWVLLTPTIATFAYGTAFAPAGVPLQCLAGICILAAVHGHFRFGMIAAGQQRFATLSTGIGTVVALGSIPWAYRENGITGVALALVVAEAVVLVACYAFGVRQLRLDRPLRALLRPMLIGGPVVAAVALLPSGTPVSGRVAIFVVGLGLAAWFGEPDLQETWRRLRERTPEEPPR